MNPNTIGIPIVRLQYGDAMLLKLGEVPQSKRPRFSNFRDFSLLFFFLLPDIKKGSNTKDLSISFTEFVHSRNKGL